MRFSHGSSNICWCWHLSVRLPLLQLALLEGSEKTSRWFFVGLPVFTSYARTMTLLNTTSGPMIFFECFPIARLCVFPLQTADHVHHQDGVLKWWWHVDCKNHPLNFYPVCVRISFSYWWGDCAASNIFQLAWRGGERCAEIDTHVIPHLSSSLVFFKHPLQVGGLFE